MTADFPTLVLALYNRKEPSLRCLDSLSAAIYPNRDIRLIISIDNDEDKNRDVLELAEKYHWKHGEKEVIYHKKKLGVRDHFNFCGDFTGKYGSVIFMEDDLFVSRYFYDYALQALEFYKNDENVAGISLFNKTRIEGWKKMFPFTPLDDGRDNYFLQQASSGQVWTDSVWKEYKKWFAVYGNEDYVNSLPQIPYTVKSWPGDRSWKKFYITFMILNNKYYVFPRISLVTNFDDVGTNSKTNSLYHQNPLLIDKKKFTFSSINDSLSVYDSYFEILPRILKSLNPELSEFDFEVNLYGDKKTEEIGTDIVLSRMRGAKNLKQFNLVMKPHEMNIIFNTPGNKIFLSYKEGLRKNREADIFVDDFVYYYRRLLSLKEMGMILFHKVKRKF